MTGRRFAFFNKYFFFLFYIYLCAFYLKGKFAKSRDRDPSSIISLPKWPELSRCEVRNLELLLVPHIGAKVPRTQLLLAASQVHNQAAGQEPEQLGPELAPFWDAVTTRQRISLLRHCFCFFTNTLTQDFLTQDINIGPSKDVNNSILSYSDQELTNQMFISINTDEVYFSEVSRQQWVGMQCHNGYLGTRVLQQASRNFV